MSEFKLKTYAQVAEEWYASEKEKHAGTLPPAGALFAFARHLDKGISEDIRLQVMGIMQAREIDREVMQALIAALGEEKANEVVKPVLAKYATQKPVPSGS